MVIGVAVEVCLPQASDTVTVIIQEVTLPTLGGVNVVLAAEALAKVPPQLLVH